MKTKILYIHPAAATEYLFTEHMVWEQVDPVNIMQCLCWTVASKHSSEQQGWKSILFMYCSRHQINRDILYLDKKPSTARQPCYFATEILPSRAKCSGQHKKCCYILQTAPDNIYGLYDTVCISWVKVFIRVVEPWWEEAFLGRNGYRTAQSPGK